MKKIELLSPVGNMDMLYQAIHNGADAVYLAGKNYGARKFANNFTDEELISAINYSHLYGVLVYVTINTLIYEEEIENFIKYVEFLHKNNVDAVIMQDIGMIKLVREKFPNLVIHASTQTHTHNKECINLFKSLGCKRVVLAREMNLDEIKKIDEDIEIEVFVYGALCVCYSGCCLMSSLNGGRSANRGECVGSCRLPYKLLINNKYIDTEDNYLLSTKELNTLNNLEAILNSNIDSLKIEGRMKSPYYVGYVTKLFRTLIDKYYNKEELSLTKEELKNLKKLYNRKFTSGYLFGDNIMNPESPNHQGIPIGKVTKITPQKIYINLTEDLSMEDGIRFKNQNKGMIINKLYNKNNLLVKEISKGNTCIIDNKINIKNKDIVLKTIDKKLINSLENYNKKRIEVSFKAEFKLNKKFKLTISDGINNITEYGQIVEHAINNSITKDNITKSLNKLGNTPFIANNIDISMDNNIFVGLKSINETRRKLVDKLIEKRIEGNEKILTKDYNIINNINNYQKFFLNILVRTEEQLKCAIDNNLDNIYITDYKLYNKYKHLDNIYYRCSRVNNKYKEMNQEKLLVCEPGSIYKYKDNNILIADYFLNITNSHTINYLETLNISRVTLSPELNYSRIKAITNTKNNVEIIIYGRLESMIMKYNLKNKYTSIAKINSLEIEDTKHKKYPIITDENNLTHILDGEIVNNIKDISNYKQIGIYHYRIELFNENYNQTKNIINNIKKVL